MGQGAYKGSLCNQALQKNMSGRIIDKLLDIPVKQVARKMEMPSVIFIYWELLRGGGDL